MIRAPLLALALLLPVPALALTPEELWLDWQAQMAGAFGVALSAEQVPGADGSLTLRSIAGSVEGGPTQALPPESPVQEIVLRPTGDGGVAIDLGLPGSLTVPGGAEALGDLLLRQAGLSIVARDGADAVEYQVAADSLQFATLAPEGGNDLTHVAGEVWGLALRVPGDLGADRTAELGLSLDGLAYLFSYGEPDLGLVSTQTARSQGRLALEVAVTLPEGATLETLDQLDFAQALDRGLALRVDMTTGPTLQETSVTGFPYTYETLSGTEAGEGRLSLDRSGVTLAGGLGGGSFQFMSTHNSLPFVEVEYGPARAEMGFAFGPEPGDLRYALFFEEVKVADVTWDALDPERRLPRDPMSLEMDLGGRMAIDLADLELAPGAAAGSLLETLELRSLAFKGLGLDLGATGALSFPGGDVNGPPSGRAEAVLVGADGLMAALQEMGLISEDEAFQARIGLAALFGPARDLDRRETVIELREDGSVVANGVALP